MSDRKHILEIYQNNELSNQEKMKRINNIMNLGNSIPMDPPSITNLDNVNSNNLDPSNNDISTTPTIPNIVSCSHYDRDCMILSPCCNKWYSCRLCHDEDNDHKLDRKLISTIICKKCLTIQPQSNTCTNCEITFADYYCAICKLWAGNKQDIYHCHDCNICRLGKGIDIDRIHCHKCNICIDIKCVDDHKCFQHSIDSNCPVCQAYMWDSTEPILYLPCGHCIHQHCLNELSQNSFQCPTCKKSIYQDMSSIWGQIDTLIDNNTMPIEFTNWKSTIICNDCELETTNIPYHFIYHKCSHCNGYNTVETDIQKN